MPKCGRRSDNPPFESVVGGGPSAEFVNRNAPFGTGYTPTFRTKIIGGVPRYVKETQRSITLPDVKKELFGKVSTHDDAVQTDFDSSPSQPQGQHLNGKQEDWKSHSVLPPIPKSTQNEPQPAPQAPKSYSTALAHNNNTSNGYIPEKNVPYYKHDNYNSHRTNEIQQKPVSYAPRDYESHDSPREHQWKPAAGYSYLPPKAIDLTKDQELFLLHKLSVDVADTSMEQIKKVYEEMAAIDRQLTGLGSYADFGMALQKHGIYPNLNTLRLLASTCVTTADIGYIDYEKMLSFIIAAVKKGKEKKAEDPAAFYSPRNDNQDVFRLHQEEHISEGHLLRMIHQQLLQADVTLNIEKLRTLFGKADRSIRLTLSHSQIKELLNMMDVPLDDHVVKMMLTHCHTHGDGQYVWTDFINILEKVQPHATGLPIPTSKRPLEYARKYRQPNENWPHPDPKINRLEPLQGISHTDSKMSELQVELSSHNNEYPAPSPRRALQHQHISAPAAFDTARNQPSKPSKISPIGQQTKPWSKDDPDPWFDGFMKMANALDRNDLNRTGTMKPDQCKWLISEYNEIHNLGFHPQVVNQCINKNTSSTGTEIASLLQALMAARERRTY